MLARDGSLLGLGVGGDGNSERNHGPHIHSSRLESHRHRGCVVEKNSVDRSWRENSSGVRDYLSNLPFHAEVV